ncbi:MAG: hypothetical protein VW268_00770 [Rhodospirillaceae bacterium]
MADQNSSLFDESDTTKLQKSADDISGRVEGLSLELADVAGVVEAITREVAGQARATDEIQEKAEALIDAFNRIDALGGETGRAAQEAGSVMGTSRENVTSAVSRIAGLVDSVTRIEQSLGTLDQSLSGVAAITKDIAAVSKQTNLLVLNATIEAARTVDRNGYLPTHNLKFAKPQGDDPIWNNANCRNRRIFNDRTGLRAGQNTRPFFLQTYRRDMGGGNFVLMKDLSAPIMVKGRHWGGLRPAYKI